MREAYRPTRRGPEWTFSADGIAVTNADQSSEVAWSDLEQLDVGDCNVTIHIPGTVLAHVGSGVDREHASAPEGPATPLVSLERVSQGLHRRPIRMSAGVLKPAV